MASFHDFSALLGATLETKAGPQPTAAVLAGKEVVGLYFSAHWCPPCRGFTPQLGTFYDGIKTEKAFEIIFVSSDRDAAQFKENYAEQSDWAALSFADRVTKNALSKQFKVRGIPTLILLDGRTGETITTDGREGVSSAPLEFPWKPASVADVLATLPPFVDTEGEEVSLSERPGTLLLYFSAHWCPPCRGFTPRLVAFFTELQKRYPEASLAFVSSDKDSRQWASYYQSMGETWLALPFDARAQKEALSKVFNVSGIPALVLLDSAENGRKTITTDGRGFVQDNQLADFPHSWKPKPYGDLTKTAECKGSSVNDARALCVFAHKLADASQAVAALRALASKHEASETLFFYAVSDSGVARQVTNLCGVAPADGEATLVLLDLPDDGAYYARDTGDVSEAALAAFLDAPGVRKQLKTP